MSFSLFSGAVVIGGLVVIAIGLFLLQRLRVRYRPLTVETTLFWKEALEEARARVLVKRFRHPWAYALLVAIAGLLWLGVGGPEFTAGAGMRHLILVDGALLAADPARFEAAVALAEEEVASLPSAARTVVLCADRPRTLLLPEENPLLLRARLAAVPAVATTPRFEDVAAATAREADARPLALVLVGDAALDAGFLARLPEGSTARRLVPGEPRPRSRLVALGQGSPISGAVDRVDVLAVVADPGGAAVVEARLGTEPLPGLASRTEDRLEISFRDLPARGETFEVAIDGRPAGRLVLDDRRPIPCALEEGLPEPLRLALAADAGLQLVADEAAAEIVVRREGSTYGGDRPAFELSSMAEREEAFFFGHEPADDSESLLGALVDELGLAGLDGMELAARLERTLRAAAAPGTRRRVAIWSELLDDERGFTTTAEFPVFVARSLRWLADRREAAQRAAVGEPIVLPSGPVESPAGIATVTLGDAYMPLRAGRHRDARGGEFEAGLLDPVLAAGPAALAASEEASGGGLDAFELVLLLALALLLVEWFLLKTGRIP